MKRALLLTLICLGFYGGLMVALVVSWNNPVAWIGVLAGMSIVQSLHVYMDLEKN